MLGCGRRVEASRRRRPTGGTPVAPVTRARLNHAPSSLFPTFPSPPSSFTRESSSSAPPCPLPRGVVLRLRTTLLRLGLREAPPSSACSRRALRRLCQQGEGPIWLVPFPPPLAGVWLHAGEPLRAFLPFSLRLRSLHLNLAKRARHFLSTVVAGSAPFRRRAPPWPPVSSRR
jgi:hypothetical protein